MRHYPSAVRQIPLMLRVSALLACALIIRAQAQSYSINWHAIAGGGGTSTGTSTNGTVYGLSGTIGQASAGTLSGGNYTINGGFWGIIGTVQTIGAPVLSIRVASPNIVISWPASATGYTLQRNSNLNATNNWTAVGQSVVVVNGTNTVTLPITAGYLFFRLVN